MLDVVGNVEGGVCVLVDDMIDTAGTIVSAANLLIERGEDPTAARLAALKEFGNVTLTRDSIQGVWRHR